jgi:hypothetical protein
MTNIGIKDKKAPIIRLLNDTSSIDTITTLGNMLRVVIDTNSGLLVDKRNLCI